MRVSKAGVFGAIAALLVAAICIRLGFWQLDRLEQRRSYNMAASAALQLPPLTLDAAMLDEVGSDPEAFVLRRAILQGRLADDGELILRGRSHEGRPGVHLVTALESGEGDPTVLVNRGWVPSPDAATIDPRPYRRSGEVTVEGILQRVPESGAEAAPLRIALPDTTVVTYRRLDFETLDRASDGPLLPLYLELVPDGDGQPPIPVPLPTFDEGSHLVYAVQWFSFAAIAILGLIVLIVVRQRNQPADFEPRSPAPAAPD